MDIKVSASKGKMVYLEAVRGLASIIVLFHHFVLAFIPSLKNVEAGSIGTYVHRSFMWLFNGDAAVVLFFVLSGFVLTQRFFKSPRYDDMAIAVLKRWPRLLLLSTCAFFYGYVMFVAFPPYFIEAGQQSNSVWLQTYANAGKNVFEQATFYALTEWLTLYFNTHAAFNTNLWTMMPELFGSFLSFFLCFLIMYVAKGRYASLILGTAGAALFVGSSYLGILNNFLPFVAGTYLAYRQSKKTYTLDFRLCLIGIVLCIMLFSATTNYNILILGAFSLIFIFLSCARISSLFSGKVGLWLGKISFPLYLVHAPILCFPASYVFIKAAGLGWFLQIGATAMVTLFCCALFVPPFMWLESKWVPYISAKTSKFYYSLKGKFYNGPSA